MSSIKEFFELLYWRSVKLMKGELTHDHYKYFFTENFELDTSFYENKKVLDIGCGPRGSLEWATMAAKRVGLDPLADKYLKMGANKQQMEYVKAYVESMPFPDDHFDIVTSYNSLDHVADMGKASQEIIRVMKPGAYFLLAVDIHQYPTLTEPQTLSWNILEEYFSTLEIIRKNHLKIVARHKIYKNLRHSVPKSENDSSDGILRGILKKPFI